jgi:hypothetical protein
MRIAAQIHPPALAESPKAQSFQDGNDLACGLQIINADGL